MLGRFLSPDPYIQDPTNSQNYNRYSYCLNNPLKYTDVTGEKSYYYDKQCYVDANGGRVDWSEAYMSLFEGGYFRGGSYQFGMGYPSEISESSRWYRENAQQNLNQYINLLQVLGAKINISSGRGNYVWLSFAYMLSPTEEDVANYIQGEVIVQGFKFKIGRNLDGFAKDYANSATSWDIASLGFELNKMALLYSATPLYRTMEGASKATGALGTGAGVAGLYVDYKSMQAGNMSTSRFGYHLINFGVSVGVGSAYGGIPGAITGSLFWAGETIYDYIIMPAAQIWWQIDQKLNNPTFYIR